jgi:general secretion pathway protein G
MVVYTARLLEVIRKKTRRCCGLTLVELLLALVISGILATIAVSAYSEYMDRLKTGQAKNDILLIQLVIQRFYTVNFKYPESLGELTEQIPQLDPWGNPYQYLNIATTKGKGKVRKDHNLVPLNSDYDLYSMGKDGKSVSPLTAKASRDDIVRANNGGFIGLASEY